MQISSTEELVKELALDFIHNKTCNISILQLLCQEQKIHASTAEQEISKKINIIDKGLELLRSHQNPKKDKQKSKRQSGVQSVSQRNLNSMVSILIFNISAINQHYMSDIEKQMAESTASQSVTGDLSKTLYKDQIAINILKEHISCYFNTFTENSQFLHNIISEILTNSSVKISDSQLGLLQTLDYLCVKYSIHNQTSEQIVSILEKNQNTIEENISQISKTDFIKDINRLLFTERRQSELYHLLETNSYVNLRNLAGIINANYLNVNPSRRIFSTAEMSGKQTIEGIIVRVIKRIGKNELFSQKNQDYSPFRLILIHLFTKHFSIYREFNSIVKSLMGCEPVGNESQLNKLRKIERFFRIFLSIENPLFQQMIQFTFNVLSNKYSESVALQLMKKFILNRFLLNSSFFVLYSQPNQQEIKQYVQAANLVRALFYTNKASELAQKYKSPQLIKISSQILHSLEYCLRKEKDTKKISQSPNFLYVNDKILKGQMQQLWEQLKQSSYNQQQQGSHQKVPIQNMVSEHSLSFSLMKNEITKNNLSQPYIENVSEVRLAANSNRTNLKDNQSIQFMYEQLRGQKHQNETPPLHNQLPPKSPEKKLKLNTQMQNKEEKNQNENESNIGKVSQLTRKQHQLTHETRLNSMNLPTDRQMIEELVQLRKQYGEMKKSMKRAYEGRKSRNSKKIALLWAFSARFNQFKAELETQNNTLYVHMTTIA